ncbi:DUF4862 family protein [Subtercola sp. PAMC28395]|uniref:DUF4862 family protein n=1 Tax=Subtercola sp. PAMC28395 TaxID=2846775 RepID=UPI001C0E3D23|nr:DUF4862 family protein [Subtercola sp. PAMC28395]QWT24724.1 DUF4862 family protein [Subtercola sp. PAMC28395]
MTQIVVGAYAAAPPRLFERVSEEAEWYALLRTEQLVGGLELAFDKTLHHGGMTHLASLLHPEWSSVVTAIPGTGRALITDPEYGLASDDEEGRLRAMTDIARLHREVTELSGILGERSIRAVQLHSAPNALRAASSARSFAQSLGEIASWSWGRTMLMVEHCDAPAPDHVAEKGFLQLADEIEAVREASAHSLTGLGHTINWARSAIETRSADSPERHLAELSKTTAPVAIMFSGVSADVTPYGGAFADSHLPVAEAEPSSLLTTQTIERIVLRFDQCAYLGVKVGSPAERTQFTDRFEPTRVTAKALDQALAARSRA